MSQQPTAGAMAAAEILVPDIGNPMVNLKDMRLAYARGIDEVTALPDLLDALELALQGLDIACKRPMPDDTFIGFVFAADKARVALAKAKQLSERTEEAKGRPDARDQLRADEPGVLSNSS